MIEIKIVKKRKEIYSRETIDP